MLGAQVSVALHDASLAHTLIEMPAQLRQRLALAIAKGHDRRSVLLQRGIAQVALIGIDGSGANRWRVRDVSYKYGYLID
ncbi:hypothetical protein P5W99_37310 [Paraburkholderia sp. A3BS-1L]|uniref:hypothetical protein n=1 Tax=Paraburkholderia sp. A3BS-1L TaxID=3028375 RepID=UPI003DA875D0